MSPVRHIHCERSIQDRPPNGREYLTSIVLVSVASESCGVRIRGEFNIFLLMSTFLVRYGD